VPKYSNEDFARRIASLERTRRQMRTLAPVAAVLGLVAIGAGRTWFGAFALAMALFFAVMAWVLFPRKIRTMTREHSAG
jgi:hypothetical protein